MKVIILGLQDDEEIMQNVHMIMTTLKGSVPFDRNFGTGWSFVDAPAPHAMALFSSEIIEAVNTYEPRVIIEKVEWVQDGGEADGKFIPRVMAKRRASA